MNLEEKKRIAQDLNKRFLKAAVVIVTDYKGLDVAAINDLRRQLRKEEVEYQVVKNSLLVRASEETDVSLIKETFKGPSAVALSYSDPVAPAKVLTAFAKDHDAFEVKVGVMGGKILDVNEIKALSALPPREALLGGFVSINQLGEVYGIPDETIQKIFAFAAEFLFGLVYQAYLFGAMGMKTAF